jgi:hypothetical protein
VVSDLVSFDAFELLSAGLGCAGLLFALNRGDMEKLSELLGAIGITSILSANPLTGFAAIVVTAYAYHQKRGQADPDVVRGASLAKGAMIAGLSSATFMLFGLPMLVEMAIVMVVVHLARKHADDAIQLAVGVADKLRGAGHPSEAPAV